MKRRETTKTKLVRRAITRTNIVEKKNNRSHLSREMWYKNKVILKIRCYRRLLRRMHLKHTIYTYSSRVTRLFLCIFIGVPTCTFAKCQTLRHRLCTDRMTDMSDNGTNAKKNPAICSFLSQCVFFSFAQFMSLSIISDNRIDNPKWAIHLFGAIIVKMTPLKRSHSKIVFLDHEQIESIEFVYISV